MIDTEEDTYFLTDIVSKGSVQKTKGMSNSEVIAWTTIVLSPLLDEKATKKFAKGGTPKRPITEKHYEDYDKGEQRLCDQVQVAKRMYRDG